eukprot:TRINITY_DN7418_c0_g1_i3.p1 TRINITY_DN7418_c0_g1~~TRINITY_DN7418_c0_g1_i3.p1  ORF type:complete len:344 (+),score=39.30 TRINITY_DN7418_c0_g1_i3:163-1194(+)
MSVESRSPVPQDRLLEEVQNGYSSGGFVSKHFEIDIAQGCGKEYYGRLGTNYQAHIREPIEKDSDSGMLVWNPSILAPEVVNEYLNSTKCPRQMLPGKTVATDQFGSKVVPIEIAFHLLHQSAYALEVAKHNLFSRSIGWVAHSPSITWDKEDVLLFEEGMSDHYKRFCMIQKDYLPHKSLSDITEFYYSWKRSVRHSMWIHRHRSDFESSRDLNRGTFTTSVDNGIEGPSKRPHYFLEDVVPKQVGEGVGGSGVGMREERTGGDSDGRFFKKCCLGSSESNVILLDNQTSNSRVSIVPKKVQHVTLLVGHPFKLSWMDFFWLDPEIGHEIERSVAATSPPSP